MTMEDETGFVNVVMWPKIYERNKVLAKTAYFLGVTGKIQKQDDVVHLVADTLWQPELGDRPQHNKSRDFR
jgi:error-prone DNA polymerase